MNKFIIHNDTELTDLEALERVTNIVRCGKVSETSKGKQYCFLTTYKDGIVIGSNRNKDTYTFKIEKE